MGWFTNGLLSCAALSLISHGWSWFSVDADFIVHLLVAVLLNPDREACIAAQAAVRERLVSLAQTLQPNLSQLVGAVQFVTIVTALQGHVREACRRRWALPDISIRKQQQAKPFAVQGLWPYWLEGSNTETVKNTFDLEGMILLTGPNMTGGSTVMWLPLLLN